MSPTPGEAILNVSLTLHSHALREFCPPSCTQDLLSIHLVPFFVQGISSWTSKPLICVTPRDSPLVSLLLLFACSLVKHTGYSISIIITIIEPLLCVRH